MNNKLTLIELRIGQALAVVSVKPGFMDPDNLDRFKGSLQSQFPECKFLLVCDFDVEYHPKGVWSAIKAWWLKRKIK